MFFILFSLIQITDSFLIPVQEGKEFCVSDDYATETLVQVKYKFEVHKNETNRRPVGVTVSVVDPNGADILRSEQKPSGLFSFTSMVPGEHQLCLATNSSFLSSKRTLYLSMEVKTGFGESIADQEANEAPEVFLKRLESKMHMIEAEQKYYLQRHNELITTESNNALRIVIFHIIQILIVIGFGYLQLRFFIKFLKLRKII
ncbi:putative p24 family protein alpha [Monocercomonoides exilis]|uniref:putative p24 family protein alpha n=1 Tax=Monocercomonoides exilis TaxID=2049356 RepID=UPI003559B31D|nr:putative p24 family protein alpha [Monocercomonoides exilis]